MAKVKIYLKPDGQIEIQVLEVKGKSCLKETGEIEKSLGEVIRRDVTSEYYQAKQSQPVRKQRQTLYE